MRAGSARAARVLPALLLRRRPRLDRFGRGARRGGVLVPARERVLEAGDIRATPGVVPLEEDV